MRELALEQVLITHYPCWNKWPNTDDMDYSAILASRQVRTYEYADLTIKVTERVFPAFLPYILAKQTAPKPPNYGIINNLQQPTAKVKQQFLRELSLLTTECQIVYWDHAWQCFPEIAQTILPAFKLSVLLFADDCPDSSPVITFPVAKWFNSLIHSMWTYDFLTGATVPDEYARYGLHDCHWIPNGATYGTIEWLKANLNAQRTNTYDLSWVGNICLPNTARGQLLAKLNTQLGGIKAKLHGSGMRDDYLQPVQSVQPAAGLISSPLYMQSIMGLNVPLSSIWNCRLGDLAVLGVPMIAWDPWRELEAHGLMPGEHWISFDGTPQHLVNQVLTWKQRPADLSAMAQAMKQKYLTLLSTHNIYESYKRIIYKRFA